MNVPLPAGSGRSEIMSAITDMFLPAMEKYQPDLIMISAGFDSRIDDPLGSFTLQDEDFADCTRIVMDVAHACCAGRLVSTLEGGYNLPGLASAAAAHVRTLQER